MDPDELLEDAPEDEFHMFVPGQTPAQIFFNKNKKELFKTVGRTTQGRRWFAEFLKKLVYDDGIDFGKMPGFEAFYEGDSEGGAAYDELLTLTHNYLESVLDAAIWEAGDGPYSD